MVDMNWIKFSDSPPPNGQFVLMKLTDESNYCELGIVIACILTLDNENTPKNVWMDESPIVIDDCLHEDPFRIDEIDYWTYLIYDNQTLNIELDCETTFYDYKKVWLKYEH